MIEGQTISMGGKEFIVPPLNFKRLKKLKPLLEELSRLDPRSADMSDEALDAAVTVVHSALSRNYPDLEKEQVEELLDMANFPGVMAAVMGQSGLTPTGE